MRSRSNLLMSFEYRPIPSQWDFNAFQSSLPSLLSSCILITDSASSFWDIRLTINVVEILSVLAPLMIDNVIVNYAR